MNDEYEQKYETNVTLYDETRIAANQSSLGSGEIDRSAEVGLVVGGQQQ